VSTKIDPPLRSTDERKINRIAPKSSKPKLGYVPVAQRRRNQPIQKIWIAFILVSALAVFLMVSFYSSDKMKLELINYLSKTFPMLSKQGIIASATAVNEDSSKLVLESIEAISKDKMNQLEEARQTFYRFSKTERVRIQRWLSKRFNYEGQIDGLWGPKTGESVLRANLLHQDISALMSIALQETPPNEQTSGSAQSIEMERSVQISRQRLIAQILLACNLSSRGSFGESLADAQLFALTGQRCAKPALQYPSLLFGLTQPLPSPSRQGMDCRWRNTPNIYRIPGMVYSPTLECH
jgi:hypothetical protein